MLIGHTPNSARSHDKVIVAAMAATQPKLKQPIADVVDVVMAVHAKSMKSISAANTNRKQFFGIKIVLFKDKLT